MAILFILLTLFIAVGLAGADGQDGKDGAGADGEDDTENTTLYNFSGHDFSLSGMIFYMEDVTEQEMHEVAWFVYLFGDFKRIGISYSRYRNWQYCEFKFCKKYIDYIKPTLKYKPGVFTMHQLDTSAFLERKLPQRLITELTHLAEKYRGKGIRLFIFGSFARSDNRRASDLDLGVLWTKQRVPRIFTELYRDVQELPTIRKIDLVDMEQVDDRFKKEALKDALFFLEDETSV